MLKRAVHFIGFLVNVDDSILKLRLGDGFEIEKKSQQQVRQFLSKIEFHYGLNGTTQGVLGFGTDGKPSGCYCIIKHNVEELEDTSQGGVVIKRARLKEINQSVRNKVRLLRLFREGNVFLRFSFFYHMKDSELAVFQISKEGPIADMTRFKLEENEISKAHLFLVNNKIPFDKPYLQLTFESFELSYKTHNLGLAFLSLMIGLEALLNPGQYELRYRISRNAAVLLGKNYEESESIFKEIRELYDKRSKLVHEGNKKAISQEDVLKLRDYVRKSIKTILTTGSEKQDLINALNTKGFGERH